MFMNRKMNQMVIAMVIPIHLVILKDICNQTFEINISGGRSGLYQLGFIVCKKDSTQAFRTDDLNNNIFKFSRDVLVEYNVADLTTDYCNYYNVGNIINYKNRIYIANYNEKLITMIEL